MEDTTPAPAAASSTTPAEPVDNQPVEPRPSTIEAEKELIKRIEHEANVEGRKVGDTFYLVSNRWYKAWKDWVVWDSYHRLPQPAPPPGPIENDVLVEHGCEPGQEKVRKTVMEVYDYIFVSPNTWRHWHAWYGGGPALPRKVIASGWSNSNLLIEVRLLTLTVLKSSAPNDTVTVNVSKATTVGEFKTMMSEKLGVNPDEVRLWDYHGNNRYKLLEDLTQRLEQVQIIDGQPMLLEEKTADGKWPELPKVHRHYGAYNYQPSSFNGPTDPGTTGLLNLGNTCFMNSALQCLSQTPPLVNYLLQDKYKSEINADNPLGMKGELAEEYAALVKELWSGAHGSYAPRDFKWKLERFAPQFAGYQQHDSQELLAFLLDGLHEDLNRIKKKPYTENPEVGDRDQFEVAREAWDRHRARNDSFVVDWFQGQLRSTLVCPKCNRTSVTFDPFMYLSLPLPMKQTRTIPVHVVFLDPDRIPVQYGVEVSKYASIRDLVNVLSTLSGIPASRITLTEVYNGRIFKAFGEKESVDIINDRDVICAYEIDVGENPEEDDVAYYPVEMKSVQMVQNPNYFYHGRGWYRQESALGIPFVLSVRNPSSLTYKQLYALIYQRLRRFLRLPKDQIIFHTGQLAPANNNNNNNDNNDNSNTSNDDVAGAQKATDDIDQQAQSQSQQQPEDEENETEEEEMTDLVAEDDDYDSSASDIDSDDENELERRRQAALRSEQRARQKQPKQKKKQTQQQQHQQQDQDDEPEPIFQIQSVDHHRSSSEMALTDDDQPLNLPDRGRLAVTFTKEIADELYDAEEDKKFEKHPSTRALQEDDDTGATVSLSHCLDLFTISETLGPEDPWYCNKCKAFQQAAKKFDLWKLPPILVVHLKRFNYKNKWFRDKIETFVDYPIHSLDLSSYVQGPKDESCVYDLYAVSNHYGSMGGGHYTAYAKNMKDNAWYKFDDSSVSPIEESKAKTSSAYVLFYRRRDVDTTFTPAANSNNNNNNNNNTNNSNSSTANDAAGSQDTEPMDV